MPTRRRSFAVAALALAGAALAMAVAPPARAAAQTVPALREHRWRHRVLVVFGPEAGPAAELYRQQLAEYARGAELLRERDVVVVPVPAGAAGDSGGTAGPALRRQLDVPAGTFVVALVGKDGTLKLRRRTLLSTDRVLATIDAMPMGVDEARRRRGR